MSFFNRYKINSEIVNYIENNLPQVDNELQLAIAIYVLLCRVFEYSPSFIFYDCWRGHNQINKVTLDNNQLICNQWAKIYVKLLKMYGIEARDVVNGVHHYVSFVIDGIIYNADAVVYGGSVFDYKMSDFANVQFGFDMSGFVVSISNIIMSQEAFQLQIQLLNNQIRIVREKICDKRIDNQRLEKLKYHIQRKVLKHTDEIIDVENILHRISLINYFLKMDIKGGSFEKYQLLKKYISFVFKDLSVNSLNFIPMFDLNDGAKIYCLLCLSIDGEYLYFMQNDIVFECVNKKDLINKIKSRGLVIKQNRDVPGFVKVNCDEIKLKKTY